LSAYSWPGNVRQLEHVLLNAWLMSEGDEIEEDDITLPEPTPRVSAPAATVTAAAAPSRGGARAATHADHKASEKDRVLSALEACGWNRLKAAEMLGVPRRTFYRRLKEFGILD
jgi:serine/threonine-protein kinase PknK